MGEGNGNRQAGQNQPLEKTGNARNGKKINPIRNEQLPGSNGVKEIPEILTAFEFMKAEGLSELEFDSDDTKIHIKRKSEKPLFSVKQVQKKEEEIYKAEMLAVASIKSPLSGTFYSASKHGMSPFVNVGDTVDEGATLCIIEAMKVMNEIKADANYKILKILATTGKPVSAGEVLFLAKVL
ncbi:MAG: acetyl-CoA carboxylase, biotin carboxyl carrier protein [Elusimicrobia bacterium]|nr:acetyl-CoA carboxylase, biotin carboxyl carrier protein [Elusimicrobiota bacterium]